VGRPGQGHGRRRSRRPLGVQVEVLHHAVVVQLLQGALARQHQDLPQRHSERPHVALRRVLALFINIIFIIILLLIESGIK